MDVVMSITLFTLVAVVLSVVAVLVYYIGPLELYRAVVSREFWDALRISLATASIATLLALPPAIAVSYMIARREGTASLVIETLLSLPFTMTPVALGTLVLLLITSTPLGRAIESLFSLLFSLRGAVAVQTVLAFSTMIGPMTSVFENISREYEDVSRTLGHGRLSTFVNIVLPMARRGLVSSALLGFMKAFSDFGATIMVAGMIIGETATLPATIYVEMSSGNTGLALALTLLSMFFSFLVGLLVRIVGGGRARLV